VLISGAEAAESETGTTAAGKAGDVAAGCDAGGSARDDCPLFNGCAGFVDVSSAGVGEAGGAVADCVAACVVDCPGAEFCVAGGAAVEEFGDAVVDGVAFGCAAGGCSAGAGVEPDGGAGTVVGCGGGVGAGFGCLTSEGGGSSAAAGGVALFCGAVDCAWHGGANHEVAQAKPADNARAQAVRSKRRLAAQDVPRLPATLLIRPSRPPPLCGTRVFRSVTT
jgi:hypothetical protein